MQKIVEPVQLLEWRIQLGDHEGNWESAFARKRHSGNGMPQFE
jgi:hypothetical protein